MPKPHYVYQKNYHEHDDRDRDDRLDRGDRGVREERGQRKERQIARTTNRRVSFKPSPLQSKGGIQRRMAEMAIRTRLEDDEDMGDMSTYRESNGARRKGSPIPKGKFGSRKLIPSGFGWYQVTVQQGHRYSKDDVIRALLNQLQPDIFIPHYWRNERNCVVFFVDDFHIAESLQKIERSVQMTDGQRLFIRVRSGYPLVTIDEPFKEKMKVAMARRYNATTRALDLSKFHADPEFKDMFCALFRQPVMSAALDIIEKNIPELVALNLNDNYISSIESFKNVAQRVPHLKILYLAENKIPSLAHLLVLRNVPIVELVLKGNPLCQRYKDRTLYVSEVRRKFPKIMKLDGETLGPQILFDVHEQGAMPTAKASYLCDVAGAEIIRQFVEQYFTIFDSDNRQPLLDAYHDQAMMSISVPPASQAGRLTSFWKYNRNFRRIVDESNKIRQLKSGRLAIVSTLAEWPKTQHDPLTFSVDMTLFTPKLINFTVTGLFKEFPESNPGGEVRYFQRQFVITPVGSGYCIRNELILVTSALHAQIKRFNRPSSLSGVTATITSGGSSMPPQNLQDRLRMNQASTSAAAAGMVQITPNLLQPPPSQPQLPSTAPPAVPDEATKMQMVQAMSAQSNMNLDWSRKCLEETNWDYNHAAFVFEKLHKESKIPPEAFVK